MIDDKKNRLSVIALVTMMMLLLLVMYLLLFPFKTLEYEDQYNMPVSNHQVKQGDVLLFHLCVCKYTNTPTTIGRRFVNDVVISLPPLVATGQKGCKEYDVPVLIPDILPPGVYYLDMTATNRVNPLREITVHYRTEEFEII